MIWTVIIGIVALVVGSIAINTGKDSQDLAGTTLDKKFNVIVNMLNQAAFNGEGEIKYFDSKHFNLYPPTSSNQLIEFLYSQGMLSITWKFKYFQKEMVFRKDLTNMRNLSLFQQERIGNQIIQEMIARVEAHKESVMML
jgi:hypothetical protein